MYMNVATILVVIVELFHLTCHFVSLCSQNDKQDSEMMAVRTADKLLKVNLPLCFFIVFSDSRIALIAVISGLTCKRGDRVNSSLY